MSAHNGFSLKRMRAADGKQEFNLEWPYMNLYKLACPCNKHLNKFLIWREVVTKRINIFPDCTYISSCLLRETCVAYAYLRLVNDANSIKQCNGCTVQ